MVFRRGECFWVKNNNFSEGSEMKGCRPAVVVSNNEGNKHSPVLEVVYMTDSKGPSLPTHVEVLKTSTGDLERSVVLCEQVHTIGKHRIDEARGYICRMSDGDMDAIDEAIMVSLGLEHKASGTTKYIEVEKKSPDKGNVDSAKIIDLMHDKTSEVLSKLDELAKVNITPDQLEAIDRTDEMALAMAKMEAEFYKKKYDELHERIMAKLDI